MGMVQVSTGYCETSVTLPLISPRQDFSLSLELINLASLTDHWDVEIHFYSNSQWGEGGLQMCNATYTLNLIWTWVFMLAWQAFYCLSHLLNLLQGNSNSYPESTAGLCQSVSMYRCDYVYLCTPVWYAIVPLYEVCTYTKVWTHVWMHGGRGNVLGETSELHPLVKQGSLCLQTWIWA